MPVVNWKMEQTDAVWGTGNDRFSNETNFPSREGRREREKEKKKREFIRGRRWTVLDSGSKSLGKVWRVFRKGSLRSRDFPTEMRLVRSFFMLWYSLIFRISFFMINKNRECPRDNTDFPVRALIDPGCFEDVISILKFDRRKILLPKGLKRKIVEHQKKNDRSTSDEVNDASVTRNKLSP